MSLDVGQVVDLHRFECGWCRILSPVLSLSVVKVVGWIGQHYECSRSSEGVVVESIAMKQTCRFRDWLMVRGLRLPEGIQSTYLTQRKPLGRADGVLRAAQQQLAVFNFRFSSLRPFPGLGRGGGPFRR